MYITKDMQTVELAQDVREQRKSKRPAVTHNQKQSSETERRGWRDGAVVAQNPTSVPNLQVVAHSSIQRTNYL